MCPAATSKKPRRSARYAYVFCLLHPNTYPALTAHYLIYAILGMTPGSSFPYVVSRIGGMSIGIYIAIIYSGFVLIQILILRKEFQWINLTQVLLAILLGYFVDFAKWVLKDLILSNYALQLVMMFFSILLIAIGVCIYMEAKLVNMPMEGMVSAIADKVLTRKKFHEVKVIMDCVVVVMGVLSSIVFLGRLEGIREGTFLCALFVGKLMKPLQKVITPVIEIYLK